MSIPYWREVCYIDDGVSEFECLSCYHVWRAWTAPWIETETYPKTESEGNWNFCPVCGVKWEGKKLCKDGVRHTFREQRQKRRQEKNTKPIKMCKYNVVSQFIHSCGERSESTIEKMDCGYKEALKELRHYLECEKREYLKAKEYNQEEHHAKEVFWLENNKTGKKVLYREVDYDKL